MTVVVVCHGEVMSCRWHWSGEAGCDGDCWFVAHGCRAAPWSMVVLSELLVELSSCVGKSYDVDKEVAQVAMSNVWIAIL